MSSLAYWKEMSSKPRAPKISENDEPESNDTPVSWETPDYSNEDLLPGGMA